MEPLIIASPYKKGHQSESFTNVSGGGLMVKRIGVRIHGKKRPIAKAITGTMENGPRRILPFSEPANKLKTIKASKRKMRFSQIIGLEASLLSRQKLIFEIT